MIRAGWRLEAGARGGDQACDVVLACIAAASLLAACGSPAAVGVGAAAGSSGVLERVAQPPSPGQ